jgi:DNA polymerase V
VHELRGIPCHELDTQPAPKKTTCCSRTFGSAVTNKDQVRDSIVSFAERAAENIRHSVQVCGSLQVFLTTDPFDTSAPQHSASASSTFMSPTSDSRAVVAAAIRIFERIWRDGFAWRKAGVLLLDLSSAEDVQPTLFTNAIAGSDALMQAVDRINDRYGRGAIGLGLAAKDAEWRMRQDQLSPRYTTRWKEIPMVRLGGPTLGEAQLPRIPGLIASDAPAAPPAS